MTKRLVIVESPTKAKTIRNFLGSDYRVEACMGHVRDLPESASEIPESLRGQDWARLGVNVRADFEPLYVVSSRKKKVISALKDALKDASELIVATDEDREGESIGWHLLQVLRPKVPVRRMVFHEITRDAIQESMKNFRAIDDQLVRAQETRRILDRLVGYTVSPLLWKKVAPGLSAGRVQSVAVRLLVSREEERRAFKSGSYWDLRAILFPTRAPKDIFEATLTSVNDQRIATGKDFDETTGQIAKGKKVLLLDEPAARDLRDKLILGDWRVAEMTEKPQVRKPPPPFTTSTLQQEANRKLRLTSKQTMQIAQKLYEEGLITYMRTDSVHLSAEAISAARRAITTRYGGEYLSPTARQYSTKSKNAQEAHEAIRPAGTAMRTADELGLTGAEGALYDMIWKRTIATQMADARLTTLTVLIAATHTPSKTHATFQANGNRIDFPGFFRAYVEGTDDPEAALEDREVRLPRLETGEALAPKELTPLGHETQPPARFTEATLVKMLESEGVGRPSTYATIIGTIQDRGYVSKQNNQLVPTFMAFAVTNLLEGHFPELVDTRFTARMEEELDEIAEGKAQWLPYLRAFYLGDKGLETQVNQKEESIDPRDVYALKIDGMNARVRIGKYGPYLELENGEGEMIRVSLPPEMPPAELKPDEATRLLEKKETGPNILGQHPETGTEVSAGVGRFGPYIKHGDEFRSLAAGDDVLTIGLPRALELLSQPKGARGGQRRAPEPIRTLGAHPADGAPVVVMSGRFGPYVKHGAVNATLPRGTKPEGLTMDQAVTLLDERAKNPPAKPRRATRTANKPGTSTGTKKPAARKPTNRKKT